VTTGKTSVRVRASAIRANTESLKGVGDEIGEITLEDGSKIDAGRVLIQGA